MIIMRKPFHTYEFARAKVKIGCPIGMRARIRGKGTRGPTPTSPRIRVYAD